MIAQTVAAEVLAPAGSLDHLDAALDAGADAVYVGLKRFSSRPDAWSLDVEEVARATARAHELGRRVYVAVNAELRIGRERELEEAVGRMDDAGVDAYIVGDLGLLQAMRGAGAAAPIHASCLLGVYNAEGVRFLRERFGVGRVILNTNLFVDEIAELHRTCPEVELEIIAHGGVCFHDSRRCRKPHYLYEGEYCVGCKQHYLRVGDERTLPVVDARPTLGLEERRPELHEELPRVPGTAAERFVAQDPLQGERLVWSPEIDLSGMVALLLRLGIVSFKIEGRTRTTAYVRESTARLRAAVDQARAGGQLLDPTVNPFYYLAHHSRLQVPA
ncbi:MAG: peptidase U32 family protein [Longimicrobiaceae bacterium]